MSIEGAPPEFKGLPPAHPVQMRSTAVPPVFKGMAAPKLSPSACVTPTADRNESLRMRWYVAIPCAFIVVAGLLIAVFYMFALSQTWCQAEAFKPRSVIEHADLSWYLIWHGYKNDTRGIFDDSGNPIPFQ